MDSVAARRMLMRSLMVCLRRDERAVVDENAVSLGNESVAFWVKVKFCLFFVSCSPNVNAVIL